jgi:hypothetical protein
VQRTTGKATQAEGTAGEKPTRQDVPGVFKAGPG